MAFSRTQVMQQTTAINVAGAVVLEFYLPNPARIKRYFDTPTVAQAAHATIVVDTVFVNAGTDGSGSAVLATLTNDSDLADSTTRESGAWVAHDAKELRTEDRPGGTNAQNVADDIAGGSTIKVTITGAGTTPTAASHTVGIEYVESE